MEQVLLSKQNTEEASNSYVPRGTNVLQTIFRKHLNDFANQYEERYSKAYGKYRLDRIAEIVEEFLKCGDYKEGIARAPISLTYWLMWHTILTFECSGAKT